MMRRRVALPRVAHLDAVFTRRAFRCDRLQRLLSSRRRRRRPSINSPSRRAPPLPRLLAAHGSTGDPRWAEHGRRAFNWFLGQNHLQQWLYDASTGGCRDGLHPDRINRNQGAEATLSFLLALCDMRAADRVDAPATPTPALHVTPCLT